MPAPGGPRQFLGSGCLSVETLGCSLSPGRAETDVGKTCFAPPAKLPSKKWRDVILQVWHTDPLICPKCQHPLRVMAVIDQRAVIETILRHLGLWSGTPPLALARSPPAADAGPWTREPFDDVAPCPTYENVLTD